MQRRQNCSTGGVTLGAVPRIQFSVSKYVNMFYHLSVLFSEYFSDEESLGFLNNASYRREHVSLKTSKLHHLFQTLQDHAFYTWDFAGKSLFKADSLASAERVLRYTSDQLVEVWLKIYGEALKPYEEIWTKTEPKLIEYSRGFTEKWITIGEPILIKMSDVAKQDWKQECIKAHFVDCLYGACAWSKDIALPPFPDVDLEKKLLSHELAHIVVPDYFLKTKLQDHGLPCSMAHTITDLIAYFGVKEHVADPERRGIKPNPDYYEHFNQIFPIFEDCSKNPLKCRDFDQILEEIKSATVHG
jgi:hypothetical protein